MAAVALAMTLGGCGDSPQPLRVLGEDQVVLAFGDSLTYGTGAAPDENYPARLARATGLMVVNAGVPGEVSADGLRRLPRLLAAHQPALVIICHGGNDFLRRMPKSGVSANLTAMIETARGAGADVVLVGVPDFGLLLSTADLYGEVAKATGAPLEDDIVADVLADNSLKSDQVHPNAEGYARIASAIEALLRDHGAI